MATMKQKSANRAPRPKDNEAAEAAMPTSHVGSVLRQAREEREISLDMVADELMIRRFYLEALEKGSFHDLPERVYAMGFVKNYANYMGLDARALVEQYKRDAYGTRNGSSYRVELNMPEPVVHSVVPGRSAMMTAVIVLVALIGGVVWMTQGKKTSDLSIPEPAPVQDTIVMPDMDGPPSPAEGASSAHSPNDVSVNAAPAVTTEISDDAVTAENGSAAVTGFVSPEPSAAASAPVADPSAPSAENAASSADAPAVESDASATTSTPEAAAAAPKVNVPNQRVLEAVQSSWVEVRDANNMILFTSILNAGQILPLPDNVRLSVTTGNAGGLRLVVKGEAQPVFGNPNEVKRNIILDPAAVQR